MPDQNSGHLARSQGYAAALTGAEAEQLRHDIREAITEGHLRGGFPLNDALDASDAWDGVVVFQLRSTMSPVDGSIVTTPTGLPSG